MHEELFSIHHLIPTKLCHTVPRLHVLALHPLVSVCPGTAFIIGATIVYFMLVCLAESAQVNALIDSEEQGGVDSKARGLVSVKCL